MPSILGGCGCDCGEDVPDCTVTIEYVDCYAQACPPGGTGYTPIVVDYELYYPADAGSPVCSGTMTYSPHTTGGFTVPRYLSAGCGLTGWPGCDQVRVRLTTADPRHQSVTNKSIIFCCYYPLGSSTIQVFIPPAPGYECTCGGDGWTELLQVRAPTLELTTRYGTMALTNNTAMGPWPTPNPLIWRGMGTASVPMTATWTDFGGGICLPCLAGPGTINVYYQAAYTGCGWEITAYWGAAQITNFLFGFPCYGEAKAHWTTICEAEHALGCGNPYFDCDSSVVFDYTLPTADLFVDGTCLPGSPGTIAPGSISFSPTGVAAVCLLTSQDCLSFDPVLFELVFPPDCTQCESWRNRKAHIFADGDTWTLAQA